MASFASSATTGGARKHARTKRLNDGDNNGQATHEARKHAWRTQAAWANIDYGWDNITIHNITIHNTLSSLDIHPPPATECSQLTHIVIILQTMW